MYLCARAVALWLAACALAARAQAERPRPECRPLQKDCQYLRTEIVPSLDGMDDLNEDEVNDVNRINHANNDVYSLYGKEQNITFDEKGPWLRLICSAVQLGDPTWPRFARPVEFLTVDVECDLPANLTYIKALEALNIVPAEAFGISWPPAKTVTAASIADLPSSVSRLALGGIGNFGRGVRLMEPGALANLTSVRELRLAQLNLDRVPPQLDWLILWNVMEYLPEGALNVVKLEISEPYGNYLKSINGTAPRLQTLRIPTESLVSLVLDAPNLVLYDNSLRMCDSLRVLELTHVQASIPAGLLKMRYQLNRFTYKHGNVMELPEDFFRDTKKLLLMDLSDNKLESLPKNLFSQLKELRVLRLSNNRLTASDLRAVQLPGNRNQITVLDISGNPLRDLCPGDNSGNLLLTKLKKLQELNLAHARVPRICGRWRSMSSLKLLNLTGNKVHKIACVHLDRFNMTAVDLTDNPVRFVCLNDSTAAVSDVPNKINLKVDPKVTCNCSCPYAQCVNNLPSTAFNIDAFLDAVTIKPKYYDKPRLLKDKSDDAPPDSDY